LATDSPNGFASGSDPDEPWHALLHDLRGCLGGLKATLDLRGAGEGLEARDAARMEAGVREGLALMELARALTFGPWPDGACEPGEAWRRVLEPELEALADAFRGKATLALMGEGPWPGPLLRSFTRSLARLLMPQVLPEPLSVEAEGRADAWILRFRPVLAPPLALQPDGAPKDLHGLWTRAVAQRCRMTVEYAGDTLTLRIPRRPEGLPPVE